MSKQTDYRNKFISEKYDRMNLTFPKGKKEIYRKLAEETGMSLNAYINHLLERHYQMNERFKTLDGSQSED